MSYRTSPSLNPCRLMPLVSPVRTLRTHLRTEFFRWWERAFQSDDGKTAAVAPLRGLLNGHPDFLKCSAAVATPYPELGRLEPVGRTSLRDDIIFITARFRSGSTLLWNLFRHAPGCTAYYEPLNERRWFDPQSRGDRIDATHLDVDDYWREYEGLDELGRWYREEWTDHHLLMDERFHDPALKRYVEILIERAPGRPVLQFNRIDFRLPWFRRNFPNAKLLHIFRHPRDQWCSALMNDCCGHDATLREFERLDRFYLRAWIRDLKYHFPFLADLDPEHPYRAFYLVWKLSWIAGTSLSDASICFESLVNHPDDELQRLFDLVQLEADLDALRPLIARPALGRWTKYAPEEWFREHETACETLLADFFRY